MRIAVCGLYFDDAFADLQNRNVEGAAAEIINRDGLVLFLVEAVCHSGRRGLVDDSFHIQASNFSRIFGGLALRIIEIRGNGNDCVADLFSEVVLGGLLQFLKNQSGNLGRRVFLALGHDHDAVAIALHFVGDHLHLCANFLKAAAHETLDGVDGAA